MSIAKVSPADCLGAPTPANTNYAGYNGALLPSATDTTYTINVVSNPGTLVSLSFLQTQVRVHRLLVLVEPLKHLIILAYSFMPGKMAT